LRCCCRGFTQFSRTVNLLHTAVIFQPNDSSPPVLYLASIDICLTLIFLTMLLWSSIPLRHPFPMLQHHSQDHLQEAYRYKLLSVFLRAHLGTEDLITRDSGRNVHPSWSNNSLLGLLLGGFNPERMLTIYLGMDNESCSTYFNFIYLCCILHPCYCTCHMPHCSVLVSHSS
jgi:hypothetical protein